MEQETHSKLDYICFALYVCIVLYILNPVMILLVIALACSPTIAVIEIQVSTFLFILAGALLYHYFIWLNLRKRFLRYEGLYFGIFVPALIDRRKFRIPVKNDKRKPKGDTDKNGKLKDKQ